MQGRAPECWHQIAGLKSGRAITRLSQVSHSFHGWSAPSRVEKGAGVIIIICATSSGGYVSVANIT